MRESPSASRGRAASRIAGAFLIVTDRLSVSKSLSGPAGREPGFAEKVAFLLKPESYSDAPSRVETIETHNSRIFLTELFAHKIKKPVRNDYLDFSTLEARRRNCEEEIRLNRQLAPGIYIAAAPLVRSASGTLRIDGEGEPVDWLVRMRRLPSDKMLDKAIVRGTLTVDEQQAIARLLAGFFATAIRVAIQPTEYRRRLSDSIDLNRRELESPEFELPADSVRKTAETLKKMLADKAALFEDRVRRGRIVEGHGDLRPEHIFSDAAPVVIDRIEFNREFRVQDWGEELAFLALECERLGSPGAGKVILETVCAELNDQPAESLINFHKAHRALLRARLSIAHLRDEEVRTPDIWRPLALEYIGLARTYAGRLT